MQNRFFSSSCTSLFGFLLSSVTLSLPALADDNALHAKCEIQVRLIKAERGEGKNAPPSLGEEEHSQLRQLPFGGYQTVSQKTATTSSFVPVTLELETGKASEKFQVSVTPHSLADNKVHYSLEWTAPGAKSVVATRLGVENGRSVMLGTDLSDHDSKPSSPTGKGHGMVESRVESGIKDSQCFIVGVKVRCDDA